MDDDCSSGLVCCRSQQTGSISVRGLCYAEKDQRCGDVVTVQDAGPDTDGGSSKPDKNMSLPDDAG